MSFTDLVLGIDDAVETHLCDPAVYRSLDAPATDVEIRAVLERPSEAEQIQQTAWVRSKPTVRFRRAGVPSPRRGDLIQFGAAPWSGARETWALAAVPEAPDDGGWWVCDVEPA
ncbi:head-tail joining protein [Brevundimonas sp.]|uniref:head-tail joining protein n=1 Tax=Brevundimonas sp. TaxID=1871086 RepID=UPI002D5F76A0|nr:hypothetical protein [Brevundimonas sp.]HYD26974.1 hypothetical protein [Brevundimonas sp.]